MQRVVRNAGCIGLVLCCASAWAGTSYVNFDNGTAGDFSTSGPVSFSGGRAVLSPGGEIGFPWFPTASAQTVTAEFTIHNVQEVLATGSFKFGLEAGTWLPGGAIKEYPATGDPTPQPRVGCIDYWWLGDPSRYPEIISHSELIPAGTQKMSVKFVADVAAERTYTYAAYDTNTTKGQTAGTFHLVGTYLWGSWSSSLPCIRIQHTSGSCNIVIDDVSVTSTSVTSYTSNHHVYFDDGTAFPWSTTGTVSYSNGRMVLAPNASLDIPGFPTTGAKSFSAQFTCYNVNTIRNASSLWMGFDALWLPGGFTKIGGVAKAGCYDYQLNGGGETIPAGVTKATVKFVADVATEKTHCFVAYDDDCTAGTLPGRFHHVGTYAWGSWSNGAGRALKIVNWTSGYNFEIDDVILSWNTAPPVAGTSAPYWGARAAVTDVASNYTFTASGANGVVAGLNMTLNRTDGPCDPLWVYECNAVSTASTNTARMVALVLPIDLTGWKWWSDPSTSTTVGSSGKYQELTGCTSVNIHSSAYPLGVLSSGSRTLCIAVPVDPPRMVRFVYDATNKQLRAEFDFGFSATCDLYPNRADAKVYLFEVRGDEPFRRALERYYVLHDRELTRRAGTGGTMLSKAFLGNITDPADFHFAWNDFPEHVTHWADTNETYGVDSFVYQVPTCAPRTPRPAFTGATTTDFNSGTPGTLIPGGGVTYANGRAYVPSGGSLKIPGTFPTSLSENLFVQFTVHNLDDVLVWAATEDIDFGWKTDGIGMSGGVFKNSASSNELRAGMQDGLKDIAVSGTQSVTFQMFACASDNVTYFYAAYDGGGFSYAGKYFWGAWTNYATGVKFLNNCAGGRTLEVDDIYVARYSGAVPNPVTNAALSSQLSEDAWLGSRTAQAEMVSGILDKNLADAWEAPSYVNGSVYLLQINTDPGEHPASYPSWPTQADYMCERMDEALGWTTPNNMDGIFHDVVDRIYAKDYDAEHWEVSSSPLYFDRGNGNAVCAGTMYAEIDNMRARRAELLAQGQYMMGNGAFNGRQWFSMAHSDIIGEEFMILSNGVWNPPPRRDYLFWRGGAARRPVWAMLNDDFSQQWPIYYHMMRSMSFGMFPTCFYHGLGQTPVYYFLEPTLYDRDRSLFAAWVPVIQDLDDAGWEPVTCATASSGWWIERFGHGSTGDLYFTVYNPQTSGGSAVSVTLKPEELGLSGTLTATECAFGRAVTVNGSTLSVNCGPLECVVIRVN